MRNGNGESLSRAKEALKGRLKQKMMQDVLDELQDTEPVVQEAFEAFASKEDALREAKEAIKTRLSHYIRQQAVEEVVAEIQEGRAEVDAEESSLAEANAAYKKRLLEHVLQQAIREVGAEIDTAQDAPETYGEALSEATEAFKTRLRDHAIRQAVAEIGTAQDAPETYGEALSEVTEAFKTRLRDHAMQQAVAEIEAVAKEGTDPLMPHASEAMLAGIKESYKQQLLDGIFQQAIDEIDAEVDGTADDLTVLSMAEDQAVEEVEPISDFTMEIPDEEAGLQDVELQDVESVYTDEANAFERLQDDPVLDVHFWEDQPDDLAEEESAPPVELSLPEDEIEEEPGFFLSDRSAAGSASEAAVNSEEDTSLFDDLLDFDGNDAWENTVSYADPHSEPYSGHETESFEYLVNDFEEDAASLEEEGVAEYESVVSEGESTGYYLYGVFSSDVASTATLTIQGIDPVYPVYLLEHEHNVALVSKVSREEYGQDALAVNLLDPVWKEQRAKAHETIIEQVSEKGLFLPVPFGTVYASEEAVRKSFIDDGYVKALDRIQGRSQWRVRLYRNVDVLHQKVVESSPAVQQLMADIKSKTRKGGQSIKKQMVETIHEEEALLTDTCTKAVHEKLFARADDVQLGALESENERDKLELILDATYLVQRDDRRFFEDDIGTLKGEYARLGFEFDVTGPESPALFSHFNPFSTP